MILRRSRGYAPLPINLKKECPQILAVGAHQKNTVAISIKDNAIISQHIGDLETQESYEAFVKTISSLQHLYGTEAEVIVCDLHPDYLSSKFARAVLLPTIQVQHHFAHIASCMAENQIDAPVLGVAWDGTGYGIDGTIWGGEFITVNDKAIDRVSAFRSFRLPGGAKAIREPKRAALGLLYEIYGDAFFDMRHLPVFGAFQSSELTVLKQMLSSGFNSPWTSSAGRLFDVVASITGLRQVVSFEGQAAMELEHVIQKNFTQESYPFELKEKVDWQPMIETILDDVADNIHIEHISSKFHNTLAEMILSVAQRYKEEKVVLSGGCFQNKYLSEKSIQLLKENGFRPYWHQRVPPNDGGISLGQLYLADKSIDVHQ